MLRTITRSNKNSLTLDLPDDLVGKMIEVIAFPLEEVVETENPWTKQDRISSLKSKLKNFKYDSGGYKFDRDEAND